MLTRALLTTTALVALHMVSPQAAWADCTPDNPGPGGTVTCSGNDANGFADNDANLTINIEAGASVNTGGDAINAGLNATVTNLGTLTGTQDGIDLLDGGTINNSGTIQGSAGIRLDDDATVTNSGTIIGTGTDGIFAQDGITINNSGTIQGDDNAVDADHGILRNEGTITNNSLVHDTVEFDRSNPGTVSIINSGTIRNDAGVGALAIDLQGNGDDSLEIRNGSTIVGLVQAGAGTDTFTLGGDDDFTFDISLVDGTGTPIAAEQYQGFETFTKTGDSEVTLTGDNFEIGAFDITGGGLLVNGNMGTTAFTMMNGGLGGSGTVGSFVANAGGIISPGGTVGTLSVVGNGTFNAGSEFEVELAPDGTSDELVVGGTLTINGGTIEPDFVSDTPSDYEDGQQYQIINSNGVIGQFAAVKDDFAFVDFDILYLGTAVFLTLDIQEEENGSPDFTSIAQTQNQLSVGSALEQFNSTDAENTELRNAALALSGDEARAALNSVTGENQTASQTSSNEIGKQFNGLLGGQAGGAGTAFALAAPDGGAHLSVQQMAAFYASGRSTASQKLADPEGETARQTESPASIYAADVLVEDAPVAAPLGPSVWLTGFGGQSDVDGDGNASGFDSYAWGLAGGAETTLLSGVKVGAGIGYSKSNVDLDDRSQDSEIDSYHIGGYAAGGAARLEDGINWRISAAYSHHEVDSTRNIAFGTVTRTAEADYDARTLSGFGEIRYNVGFDGSHGRTVLSPLARIDAAHTHTDGFTETGAGGLNLTNTSQDFRQVWLGAGVGLAGDYQIGRFNWRPNWTLAYERNVGDDRASVNSTFAASPLSFTTNGARESRDRIRFGSASSFALSENARLTIATDRIWSSDRSEWSGKATLSVKF